MERIRSFIAIDVEDEGILHELEVLQSLLVSCGVDLKLVRRENIHLTLRFLGEIPSFMVDNVGRVMEKLNFPSFLMEVKGLGAFPRITRPNVIWVGVGEGHDEVVSIFNFLEKELRKLGFRPETKAFHPHITIARVRRRRNLEKIIEVFNKYRDHVFGRMTVKSIRLKRSVLTPRGPIYSTLKEIFLT